MKFYLILIILLVSLALLYINSIRSNEIIGGFTGYKLPTLPSGTKFIKGSGKYKYTALVPTDGKIKRVNFGHRDYQHYKDRVPSRLGGGLWKHLDHKDKSRMENYRTRHRGTITKSGIPAYKVKYSPSWFSYYFLW